MSRSQNKDSGYRVVLFVGNGPIAWQTRSRYVHAALLAPNGRLIESVGFRGVRMIEFDPFARKVEYFSVPSMSEEQWKVAWDWARNQIGKGYDWRGVLRFVYKKPAFGENGNGRFFCSELVHAAIACAGCTIQRCPSEHCSPALVGMSPLLVQTPM